MVDYTGLFMAWTILILTSLCRFTKRQIGRPHSIIKLVGVVSVQLYIGSLYFSDKPNKSRAYTIMKDMQRTIKTAIYTPVSIKGI